VGVTLNNYVLFIRVGLTDHNNRIGEFYSIWPDGKSAPTLLSSASSKNQNTITNVFEKVSPSNRILFRTIISTETSKETVYSVQLKSINPNGTDLKTLAINYNMEQAVRVYDINRQY